MLAAAGLQLVAAYAGGNFIFDDILPEELARVTRCADRAAELGAPHLVVGGGAKRFDGIREADYHKLAAALDRVKDLAEARGLRAHYHPHLSTIVEGPATVAKIFDLTAIDFCPDTAHLAAAGGDPAQLIRDHAPGFPMFISRVCSATPFAFTPLDRGDVPTAAHPASPARCGLCGLGLHRTRCLADPAEGARLSMDYLQDPLTLSGAFPDLLGGRDMITRRSLLGGAALLALMTTMTPAFAGPDEALAKLVETVLSKGPNGEDPSPASSITLTDEELAKIKEMHATAAIVMHYGGNDWSRAQINGLQTQFAAMGIEVIAVTDAGFKPEKQVADIETIMAQKPSIIVSIPTDPTATAGAYKAAADAGVKIVFMDNVAAGLTAGKDYVSVVSADNYGNGVAAAHLMAKALNGGGQHRPGVPRRRFLRDQAAL